ncbi:hypothetical protein C8R44DRAFT_733057 [Mycena epipterygia]|nr:hypothetical protein C8R44DRAFT_733057 [Mycena epipterygia]
MRKSSTVLESHLVAFGRQLVEKGKEICLGENRTRTLHYFRGIVVSLPLDHEAHGTASQSVGMDSVCSVESRRGDFRKTEVFDFAFSRGVKLPSRSGAKLNRNFGVRTLKMRKVAKQKATIGQDIREGSTGRCFPHQASFTCILGAAIDRQVRHESELRGQEDVRALSVALEPLPDEPLRVLTSGVPLILLVESRDGINKSQLGRRVAI